jgi:geranylgeranyl transferase type-2 subunit alpha
VFLSLTGLEALRVLVNLNLSHNRISSVTALAPLRELPLLQKVDLSFNHIGDYTVDTCRLLFSSKLSNSSPATPDSSSTEWPLKAGKHWEIKAVFEGLRWRELNIAGNSAAEDAQFLQALNRALDGARIVTQSQ